MSEFITSLKFKFMLLHSSFQKWMDTEIFSGPSQVHLTFLKTICIQAVFLVTGVFSTVMAQSIFYEGFTDHRTMLLPFCTYFSMFCVRAMPSWLISDENKNLKGKPHLLMPKGKGEQECEDLENISTQLPGRYLNRDINLRNNTSSFTEDADLAGGPKGKPHTTPADSQWMDFGFQLNCLRLEGLRRRFLVWLTPLRCLILLTVSDFFGMFCSCVGLQKAGSGLYQVIYSSVVCWAALLSWLVLHKKLSRGEWAGIVVVSTGLLFSALGQVRGPKVSAFRIHELILGILFTLAGSFFHSMCYVLGETAGVLPEPLSPKRICSFVGTANSALLMLYFCFYTIPNWNELVTQKVQAVGGSQTEIITGLFLIGLSQLMHSITYFQLLSSSGAVSTGLMQSIRASLVFGISSLLFCKRQTSQCYTIYRGVATLLVAVGITYYALAKKRASLNSGGKSNKKVAQPPQSKMKLKWSQQNLLEV